jgi:hypothetical protein
LFFTYLTQKPSFRKFCEAQSANFLRASSDARFLDSTSGAVRLALAFLGTWFHWMLRLHPPKENDPNLFCDAAVSKVADLARAIALWPAAGETNKIWDTVIREIALLVAEEVKAHGRIAAAPNIPPVSETPAGLDCDVKVEEEDALLPVECPDVSTPVILDPRNYLPSPPATPPPILIPRRLALKSPPSALSPLDADIDVGSEKSPEVPECARIPQSPRTSVSASAETAATGDNAETLSQVEPYGPVPLDPPLKETQYPHLHSRGETASCLLTGFFFGALIIIVLSQRQPARLYVS